MISTIAGACWSPGFPTWDSFWSCLGLTNNPRLATRVQLRGKIMKGEVQCFLDPNLFSNKGQYCQEVKNLILKFWVTMS